MKKQNTIPFIGGILAILLFGLYSCKKHSVEPDFTYTGNLNAGQLVTFHSNMGNGSSFLWNFGDGSKSTDPIPNHTYKKASSFVVTLTYSNDTSKKITKVITIGNAFGFNVSGITAAGHPISFTSTAPSGNSFAWDFGDGSTSNEATPTHTYAANGTYNSSLIINSGDTIKKTIYMYANAEYLPLIAGTRLMHHSRSTYHTYTLSDTSLTVTVLSPYTISIGSDTLCYYYPLSMSPDVIVFRSTNFPRFLDFNEVHFNHVTSTLDYYLNEHISPSYGYDSDHYYNY